MADRKKNNSNRNRKLLFVAVLAAILVLIMLRPSGNGQNGAAEKPAPAVTENTTGSGASEEEKAAEAETEEEPAVYTMDDVYALSGREIFAKGALKHIFCGTVNSQGNGSGYHYAMIEDADGEIIEGTKSGEDKNGVYTADVKVKGKRKQHFSTFFPDDWTPQEVVDAIAAAREDAL